MRLTEEEQRYLQCLASGMTFEQMADALGWTVELVKDFGMKFFDRAFEIRKQSISRYPTPDLHSSSSVGRPAAFY